MCESLNRRLRHLTTAMCVAATIPTAVSSARSLHTTGAILDQLSRTLGPNGMTQADAAEIKRFEQEIDDALSALADATGDICSEPAVAFIEVEQSAFTEIINLHVVGSYGDYYFYFPAGTTIDEVVIQVNAMTPWLGVNARISSVNPERIEFRSVASAPYAYLNIQQLSGSTPVVFASPLGGAGMFNWTDFGCSIGEPACAAEGTLYLSTQANLMNYGAGSTTLIVHGTRGIQTFTFASGTSQTNIITAINTFKYQTGVTARQNAQNPARIEVRSLMPGQYGFVSVMEVGGVPPMIFSVPTEGTPSYSDISFGIDRLPGDVNCDRIVNVNDLMLVVQNWGDCPLPPFVCEADLTNDGMVNVNDLLSVVNNWGR